MKKCAKPSAGMIVHYGKVVEGTLKVGDDVTAGVDHRRRQDTERNHTATHLLHAELRKVLGEHVRQAGSLVAPDRLRFDFTHQKGLSAKELAAVEEGINQRILDNYPLTKEEKKLTEAQLEGATALFGEKYGDEVRTVKIGDESPFSYELCGGTHVDETGEIGTFHHHQRRQRSGRHPPHRSGNRAQGLPVYPAAPERIKENCASSGMRFG